MTKKRGVVLACFVVFTITATVGIEENRMNHRRKQIVGEWLRSDWAAAPVQIEKGRPVWYYDRFDRRQAEFVNRVREVYMIGDTNGNVLERSDAYDRLPVRAAPVSDPQVWEATKRSGSAMYRYLLCTGSLHDKSGRPYQFTVGRRLD